MFDFQRRLAMVLAVVVVATAAATISAIVAFGPSIITQPLATLVGIVLVPSITLFGFLMQKRVERSYEVAKEARNASRNFIDASTAYLNALVQSDFGQQIEKFQLYQSSWFQLHTVMPEMFSRDFKTVLQRHYDALTAIQHARNEEREGVALEEATMKQLLMEVRDSEAMMVSALASVCTGIDTSSGEIAALMRFAHQNSPARFSRGSVAIQMGTFLTSRDGILEVQAARNEALRIEREKQDQKAK